MRVAAPTRQQMRALDLTLSVADPGTALVGGQDAGPGVTITGEAPPAAPKSWWWLLVLVGLGLTWWLVKDDTEKEGRRIEARPFAA